MPWSWGTAEVVDKDDKAYYRIVHSFTNRFRVAAQSWSIATLSQNLDTCFRGEATRWWNNEIDSVTRGLLIHATAIDSWCRVLEECFRTPPVKP
jgi:hypothetical protein